jgi:hypothetical protein
MPSAALVRLHGDPEGPTPGVADHSILSRLTTDAVDAFVAAAGPGSGSTLLSTELRQLGGAMGRPHPGGGSLAMIDGAYAYFSAALAMDPVSAARGSADAARVKAAVASVANGQRYLNFTEHPVGLNRAFPVATVARLTAVRDRVDPTGLFQANHQVPR